MTTWPQYTPELLTDLYELTMAASYLEEGMSREATFSLFIRGYPPQRAYFVSAGLNHFLEIVTGLHFSEPSLEYISSTRMFPQAFLDYLRDFRFTGKIRAIPEGRIFFAHEPVLEVTAPIIEGQLLETLALNVIQLETMIASKAARCVHAAQDRGLIDFSLRRTHGMDAGVKAARASYLVGFMGSSNLLAGKIYGIPVFGTMAHSYVTSFEHEVDSFLAFAKAFPRNTVLLIDTYDTVRGAEKAIEVAKQMATAGRKMRGVRLDSGDMADLSKTVRRMLDGAGFHEVKILASGNLDEFRIKELLDEGAAIDIFAVGTRMGVSADAPYLDIAYKLVEYGKTPVLKLSRGKKTWVGRKQVYRYYDDKGMMKEDVLGLFSEDHPQAHSLLEDVLEGGKLVKPMEPLDSIQSSFAEEWAKLPLSYREIVPEATYPVKISRPLRELDAKVEKEKRREEIDRNES